MRLTRPAFIAWLESKKPRARVGAKNPSRCPIDMYTGGTTGNKEYLSKDRKGQLVSRFLPKWAVQFVFDVDHRPGYWHSITAQRALHLLEHPNQPTKVTF